MEKARQSQRRSRSACGFTGRVKPSKAHGVLKQDGLVSSLRVLQKRGEEEGFMTRVKEKGSCKEMIASRTCGIKKARKRRKRVSKKKDTKDELQFTGWRIDEVGLFKGHVGLFVGVGQGFFNTLSGVIILKKGETTLGNREVWPRTVK